MINHLEPDILEYEVKWALGSITTNKASGGDGIRDIVQEAVIKTIPKKKEMQKGKMVV